MTLYISFAISLFFFNDTATTEIYTLSLHDALPISPRGDGNSRKRHDTLHALIFDGRNDGHVHGARAQRRSEEHTSELQSPCNIVCRLLLEKKNRNTFFTKLHHKYQLNSGVHLDIRS